MSLLGSAPKAKGNGHEATSTKVPKLGTSRIPSLLAAAGIAIDGEDETPRTKAKKDKLVKSNLTRLVDNTDCARDPFGDDKDDDEEEDIPTDEDSVGSLEDFVEHKDDTEIEEEAEEHDSGDEGIDSKNILPSGSKRTRRQATKFTYGDDDDYELPSDMSDSDDYDSGDEDDSEESENEEASEESEEEITPEKQAVETSPPSSPVKRAKKRPAKRSRFDSSDSEGVAIESTPEKSERSSVTGEEEDLDI